MPQHLGVNMLWRVTRIHRLIAGACVAGVLALTACSSAQGEPTDPDDSAVVAEEEVEAPVTATYCSELSDPAVLEATREYTDWVEPAVLDSAVSACAETPDAYWTDAVAEAELDATYISRVDQSFPVTDEDGYTFNIDVDFGLVSVTADPSSQLPGFTAATRETSLVMSVQNTTPQRDLSFREVSGIISPLDLPTFLFSASFNAGNPVCTQVLKSDGSCEWTLGFGRMEDGQTVAADATYTLKTWAGLPNGGESSILLQNIPEASWAEVEPHLKSPDGYRITYSGGDYGRFTSVCGNDDLYVPVLAQTNC
jgi:hypothetical protein